ncbi:MAG: leucyl/phenylalanyl-tRNA--protein transferase [Phycisphaeraceae bacterium]|nr:leucyl/phenylalanyl-tRNA--protein transferase [Phycisphaeraceae bacterium]
MSTAERGVVSALLEAYRSGYFPMADPDDPEGEVPWYNPVKRAILPLEAGGFHCPRSLEKKLRRTGLRVSTDEAFEEVTRRCATTGSRRNETWINETILGYYGALHRAGCAHSIEAWAPTRRRTLVGGIYGIAIGRAFIAESMFSRPEEGGTDASKVCLAHLVSHLRHRGYTLLDVQIVNPHTARFGVVEVSRGKFMELLAGAAAGGAEWLPFEPGRVLERLVG